MGGNQVRSAIVRTAHGIYRRPAAKLALLDVRGTSEDGGAAFDPSYRS